MQTYLISRREAPDGSVSPDLGDATVWRETGELFTGTPDDLAAYCARRQADDGWPYRGIAA